MYFGWDLRKYLDSKSLRIFQLSPDEMETSVQKVRNDLPERIQQSGATRIAMDSVSLFSMLYENPKEQRASLFQLARTIRASGATSMFTAEASQVVKASRDGLVEYVADGVIFLKLHEDERTGDVKPLLQILKMRRTDHIRLMKPYAITSSGIVVYPEAGII
jgi:KaiC/GvpD/RAD55 family RecA-like ATPase